MSTRIRFLSLCAAMFVGVPVIAQDDPQAFPLMPGQLAERGPRFLLATDSRHVPLDVNRTALLRQRLTLDLDRVSVHEAIQAIAREARVKIAFSDQLLSKTPITLQARSITVAAALTDV